MCVLDPSQHGFLIYPLCVLDPPSGSSKTLGPQRNLAPKRKPSSLKTFPRPQTLLEFATAESVPTAIKQVFSLWGTMKRTWTRRQVHHQRQGEPTVHAGKREVTLVLSWFDWEFWHGSCAFKFRRLNNWQADVDEVEGGDHPMQNADEDV